ncbi:MAG: DUF192 domain-containing protein [Chloroflexota bacterium]|nr:DUF192 domain-containing protein [Chloroflexota bacterium]
MNVIRAVIILIAATALILLACGSNTPAVSISPVNETPPSITSEPITITVELTGKAWGDEFIQGLSGRTSLDGGMLFDFQETVNAAFQMRETLIPLSIAFISEENTIVDILDMQPLAAELYYSDEPYRYAIEVNQGFFTENFIQTGDRVEFLETNSQDSLTVMFKQHK